MSASLLKEYLEQGLLTAWPVQHVALTTAQTTLAPSVTAELLGAGAVPPRTAKVQVRESISVPKIKAGTVPWQLFRTGTACSADTAIPAFDMEKLEHVIASALIRSLRGETSDVIVRETLTDTSAQLDGDPVGIDADEVMTGEAGVTPVKSAYSNGRLAAQLSIVARLNQPRARTANPQAIKAVKGRTQAEAQRLAKTRASARNGAIASARIAAHGQAMIDAGTRPQQAVVIDLAVAKNLRRQRQMERAA